MSNRTALFGTDGIRGKYGVDVTSDTAYLLGNSIGTRTRERIIVGRDTRPSGAVLRDALVKGIIDAGGDVLDLGIVSTPLVAYAVSHSNSDYGVVVTASHNSAEYNGLKVFESSGMKIDRDTERAIEEDMNGGINISSVLGELTCDNAYTDEYINMLKDEFLGISGLNVAVDTGNGALSHIGSEVVGSILKGSIIINNEGDGTRINDMSGALHPEHLRDIVIGGGLDIGFAYDGDGDRITAVTHTGSIVNGDMMLYALAMYMKSHDILTNNVVVGTPYTNIGLEKALERHGISLIRADVGDSNVAIAMREAHASLGGERAGHIILSRYGMTGDALLVSLVLCRIVEESGESLESLTSYEEYPVFSRDIVSQNSAKVCDMYANIIDKARRIVHDEGRVIVRPSGTEPKIRVMVECKDELLGENTLDYIVSEIERHL